MYRTPCNEEEKVLIYIAFNHPIFYVLSAFMSGETHLSFLLRNLANN